MQPPISISTSFTYDMPIEKQIVMVAEAGFSAISLGAKPEHSGYLDRTKQVRLAESLKCKGLVVDTVHALGLDRPNAVAEATATAEASSELGARCVVAHGGSFAFGTDGFDERLQNLVNICKALVPVAKLYGIVFALENVLPGPATDLVRKALIELDDTVFGLCYDSARDQIDGPRPFNLIDEFRGRIFAVHLSDRIKPLIDHVIPGEGFIDWPAMCAKLNNACYTNSILMEVLMQHSQYQEPKRFLKEAYKAGVMSWELIHEGAKGY